MANTVSIAALVRVVAFGSWKNNRPEKLFSSSNLAKITKLHHVNIYTYVEAFY